eukprot:9336570-Lingulodinium_polyedra.AAC.1
MGDHFDDCGDDASSLHDKRLGVLLCRVCGFDAVDELSDLGHDERVRLQFGDRLVAYPIDRAK